MKNLKFVTRKGIEVELDAVDMSDICEHYEIQIIADSLREDYTDWSEDKIQTIAANAYLEISRYGINEDQAIDSAISDYEM